MSKQVVSKEVFFSSPKIVKNIFGAYKGSEQIIIYFEDGSEIMTPRYESQALPRVYRGIDKNLNGRELLEASYEALAVGSRVKFIFKDGALVERVNIIFEEDRKNKICLLFLS